MRFSLLMSMSFGNHLISGWHVHSTKQQNNNKLPINCNHNVNQNFRNLKNVSYYDLIEGNNFEENVMEKNLINFMSCDLYGIIFLGIIKIYCQTSMPPSF